MQPIAQPTTIAYLLGTFAMLLGIPPCLWLIRGETKDGKKSEGRFGYLLGIPGFAAAAYLAMAFGVGRFSFQGYELSLLRYVDWLVTTPLLVGYTAYAGGMGRSGILGVGLADVLMIGFGAAAVVLAPPAQWAGFGFASLCYVGIVVTLYGPVLNRAKDQPPARQRLAWILVNWVALLWLVYPVIWVFGPGLKWVSAAGVSIMIVYTDVVSKVTFVYLVYRARNAFKTVDEAKPEVTETVPSAEAASTSVP